MRQMFEKLACIQATTVAIPTYSTVNETKRA